MKHEEHPTQEEMVEFVIWCFKNIDPDPTNSTNTSGVNAAISCLGFNNIEESFNHCEEWLLAHSNMSFADWKGRSNGKQEPRPHDR